MVTPRTTIWLTLCIPGIDGGGKLASLELGLRTIISVDFRGAPRALVTMYTRAKTLLVSYIGSIFVYSIEYGIDTKDNRKLRHVNGILLLTLR